jgi:hypothetical protein
LRSIPINLYAFYCWMGLIATRAAYLTRWFMWRQWLGGYRVALQIADSEELVVAPPARRYGTHNTT